jgi:hypothetical protein
LKKKKGKMEFMMGSLSHRSVEISIHKTGCRGSGDGSSCGTYFSFSSRGIAPGAAQNGLLESVKGKMGVCDAQEGL